MDKKVKLYIAIFIAVVGLIVYADATKQKPISWFPSYAAKHKTPYGTYILRNELSNVVKQKKILEVRSNPYIYLQDTTKNGTYFFVNGFINFDKQAFKKLMEFVKRGNDVFVATNGANIDTLGLKTKQIATNEFNEIFKNSLLNKKLNQDKIVFDRSSTNLVFTEIDTLKTTALGKLEVYNKKDEFAAEGINFVKHKHGKGNFYFHTAPLLFTNYNILKNENNQYVAGVLSYLDKEKPILWDAYFKAGKTKITSPLQYIFASKSLKWAYNLVLIGVLFFVAFKSKRVQRFIPVVIPLKNQTIAFTRTIANMYFEKSEHKDIASHKITYFLEYIRTKLLVSTSIINQSFFEKVAARSGNSFEDVKDLFVLIDRFKKQENSSKEQLIELNNKIEAFKKKQSLS